MLITVIVCCCIFIYSFLLPAELQHVEVMSQNLQQVFSLFLLNTVLDILCPTIPDKYDRIRTVGGLWCYGVIMDEAATSTDVTGVISLPVC